MGIKVNGKDGHMVVAKYSEQAEVMIEVSKDFNKLEFEKWFFGNLTVGSNNVLTYLMEKNKQRKMMEEARKLLEAKETEKKSEEENKQPYK